MFAGIRYDFESLTGDIQRQAPDIFAGRSCVCNSSANYRYNFTLPRSSYSGTTFFYACILGSYYVSQSEVD